MATGIEMREKKKKNEKRYSKTLLTAYYVSFTGLIILGNYLKENSRSVITFFFLQCPPICLIFTPHFNEITVHVIFLFKFL